MKDGLIEGARVMDAIQITTVGWRSRNSVRACGERNHVGGGGSGLCIGQWNVRSGGGGRGGGYVCTVLFVDVWLAAGSGGSGGGDSDVLLRLPLTFSSCDPMAR